MGANGIEHLARVVRGESGMKARVLLRMELLRMQITYLGHAGFCVETSRSIVVRDPWVSPTGAFDSAWYQFPAITICRPSPGKGSRKRRNTGTSTLTTSIQTSSTFRF